jgi:hypothetical protein
MGEVVDSSNSVEVPNSPPAKQAFHRPSRRTGLALAAGGVALLLVAVFLYLQKKAPPEAARLLPESDAIVYFNVAPIRAASGFDAHPVSHDADYQHFIDATGIQFERDLSQAAFALHRMPNPLGPNGPVAYSSIFVGKFDRTRLSNYLDGVAGSKERYDGHDIYDIAMNGRTDRVAILSSDIVAVSNTPTAEQIHSILDRNRTAFLPFSSNTLLTERYGEIPLFSLAWGLGKLGIGLENGLNIFGFRIPLSVDATFIASLRWAGALHLRVEEIAPNGAAASLSATSLEALLNIFKTAENVLPNSATNDQTKALLNSVQIENHNERAVLTATIPVGLIQKLSSPQK